MIHDVFWGVGAVGQYEAYVLWLLYVSYINTYCKFMIELGFCRTRGILTGICFNMFQLSRLGLFQNKGEYIKSHRTGMIEHFIR